MPVLFITGPTASGKTGRAVDCARRFNGEIISADSRQIYRQMDLGTGKDLHEYGNTPHHLIDIAPAGYKYNLFEYLRDASAAIEDVKLRHSLPIVCGGTGLYVAAVADGYELVDAGPDEALRERLEGMSTEELAALFREKSGEVPAFLDLQNRRRLVRACEVLLSGRDFAETRACRPRYEVLKIGVTWERPVLRQRIDERLRRRLEQGMIDEVRQGLEAGVPYEAFYNLGLEYRFIARY
ncbi:MAG: tRNA (adenosine(37)-N6)-dimethylallyltransferase MiaA, partial [Paramuribaculum sp.]|nr:tRNA (adenosine(37)-N6)-dimethylallyltransferase MiaA [Paramuribaculum sp.]